MNLGVIMGGMSTEHYVSIVSGTSIVNNLNKKKYKIFPIYIDLKGNWYKYIKPIEEIEILQVGEIPQELEKINNEIEYLKIWMLFSSSAWIVWRGWNNTRIIGVT